MSDAKEKLIKMLMRFGCDEKCDSCEFHEKDIFACLRKDAGIKADHLIANGVTVQEWIPASEPPEEYRDKYRELIPFLVCEKGTEYPFRAFYDGKTWGDGLSSIYPTHWMPLPEPPKGE